MAKQDDYARFSVRLPAALYQRLQSAAGEKSLNAEIIARLNQTFEYDNYIAGLEPDAPLVPDDRPLPADPMGPEQNVRQERHVATLERIETLVAILADHVPGIRDALVQTGRESEEHIAPSAPRLPPRSRRR